MDLWEGLVFRSGEALEETLRALKAAIREDNRRRKALVAHALAPDSEGRAWLRLSATFDLPAADGWFRTSVRPRIERRQQHALWDVTWKTAQADTQGGRGGRGGPIQEA